MAFPCPACNAPIERSPDRFWLRCPACAAVLRSRATSSDGPQPVYEVEVAGRPETRRRVEVPWDESQRRRLGAWLLWASVVTLGLAALLYAAARLL